MGRKRNISDTIKNSFLFVNIKMPDGKTKHEKLRRLYHESIGYMEEELFIYGDHHSLACYEHCDEFAESIMTLYEGAFLYCQWIDVILVEKKDNLYIYKWQVRFTNYGEDTKINIVNQNNRTALQIEKLNLTKN